ncbi:MAG: VOC family protein [Dehalococcoidia bacterium]
MAVKPIPDEYNTITPYLYFDGATKAIDWYKQAFGAKERMRMPGPGGTIGHAELEIGDSIIMMSDMAEQSPKKLGHVTSSFVLYVKDVDSAFKKAIDAGAKELQPLEDKFYGDRMGTLADPFGHEWSLGTHVEDVSPAEMQKRSQAAMAQMAGGSERSA